MVHYIPKDEDLILFPDLAARKVIVAAFLYYILDEPCMDDATYDRLSRMVADCWDELKYDRRWCCVSRRAIRSSGSHIRWTSYAVHASILRYKELTGHHILIPIDFKWKQRKRDGCSYITAAGAADFAAWK